MFVVHRRAWRSTARSPTILTGYGGFNISETPVFSATLFPWFEAGGVFALPNLRGGGEYGDAWHEAGMLEKKQNVFDDFIAAAEWLVAQKYTKPGEARHRRRLERRPAHRRGGRPAPRPLPARRSSPCRCSTCCATRTSSWRATGCPSTARPRTPQQFEFLRAYSPYQQVKKGTAYPAVLLTAGENDSRVHALHARKMAAALQAATAEVPAAKPVLLWVDREAGHGQGKPLEPQDPRRRRSAHLPHVAAGDVAEELNCRSEPVPAPAGPQAPARGPVWSAIPWGPRAEETRSGPHGSPRPSHPSSVSGERGFLPPRGARALGI